MRIRSGLLLLGFVSIGVAGCAGYRLGPANGVAAGEKSIEIQPFSNKTLHPRLTDVVTTELRRNLQRDGTYKLATHGDGDIIVRGTVTRYYRDELSFSPKDTLTVTDYRIILTAQVKAVERTSGKVLLDRAVNGYTLLRAGTDLASSERQAMPLAAEDLAKNLASLLTEGAW